MRVVTQDYPLSPCSSFARNVGQLFFDMGFISSAEVVTCSVKDLTGEYTGQTSPKVISQFERALGKVLFVDEAYRLSQGGRYGHEAAGEIVDAMTQPRYLSNMVVILAGYEKEMNRLMKFNQGLRSRFPVEVNFPQMAPKSCFQLFERTLNNVHIELPGPIEGLAHQLDVLSIEAFRQLSSDHEWANGRDVESLARKMMGQIFRREGEVNSDAPPEKLVVSHNELLRFLMDELKAHGHSVKNIEFASDAFKERLRHVAFDADME